MKKVISFVLLLAMCVACFAGCVGQDQQKPAVDPALESAAEYLYAIYKDNKTVTSDDFTVVSQVQIDGSIYPITWTTDAAEANVKITAGENNMTTIEINGAEEEITYKLIGTMKNEAGASVSVTFQYTIPAVKQVGGGTIVLAYPEENKYITGTEYTYTSSSGSTKIELVLSDNKADAIALEVVDNGDGTVTFKTGDKYLFCDATDVKFASSQDDNTKFVLEAADTDGGYFIKCAVANFNGKAQYLEVYKGYLTCYGMGDPVIYTFKLEDAAGANGSVGGGDNTTPTTPSTPTTPTTPSTPKPTTPSTPSTGSYTQVSSLKDGDKVVIVNPASNMALSMTKTGYYNVGVSVAGGFGSITNDEIFTVKKNSDGSYGFTSLSGKVLALADEFSSLNDTGANNKWELSSAGEKLFYLKNVARGNYLEWYASKSNWSTYGPESLTDEYVLAIYSTTGNGGNTTPSTPKPTNPTTPTTPSTPKPTTPVVPAGNAIVFDFSGLTQQGVEITEGALEVFNGAASGAGLTAVTLTKVFDGNGTGGAFPDSAGFLKCGTGKVDGAMELTFSKKVAKVEIVCHDWYTKSDKYPTNSNTIAVNGGTAQLAPYTTDATMGTLTFTLGTASETVSITMDNTGSSFGRVFIEKIIVTFAA